MEGGHAHPNTRFACTSSKGGKAQATHALKWLFSSVPVRAVQSSGAGPPSEIVRSGTDNIGSFNHKFYNIADCSGDESVIHLQWLWAHAHCGNETENSTPRFTAHVHAPRATGDESRTHLCYTKCL